MPHDPSIEPDQTGPDFDPPIGRAIHLSPTVRRIVAPNPSPMTFRGTNTYIVGAKALCVIDPGPDSDAHLQAILEAVGPDAQITHILVTHSHVDHSPLAARLSQKTAAPVYAFGPSGAGQSDVMKQLAASGALGGGEGVDHEFQPDVVIQDQQVIETVDWKITSLWTPGHFGNHVSFVYGDTVFCGDHVMDWSTSLVSPPDGDLTQFLWSCRRLIDTQAKRLFPGHGAPIEAPSERINWLISHRKSREAEILDALRTEPQTPSDLTKVIYADVPVHLHPMAERNVLAHLIDLMGRGRVEPQGKLHTGARFKLI